MGTIISHENAKMLSSATYERNSTKNLIEIIVNSPLVAFDQFSAL
jgi:hypothetical protein